MRKVKAVLFFLSTLLLSTLLSGQSITLSESTKLPDYVFEVFRPVPGTYVSFNYASAHGAFGYHRNYNKTFVTGYDKEMKEVYSHPVEELKGNTYLGAIEFNKRLQVFYADNKDISYFTFDAVKGLAESKPSIVFTTTNKPISFYKGFSPDSNYCFAAFESSHQNKGALIIEGVIMDNKWNVLTKFSFSLEKIKSYVDNNSFVLSSDGILFVINKVRVKVGKDDYRPFQYILTEVNKEGKTVSTYLNDLPSGRLSNIVWSNGKKGPAFTGLLSKSEKEAFQYIVSGQFSSWSKKITDLKESALGTAPFWQQASGEFLLLMKTRGISANAEMVKHFTLPDGTVIMVLQPSEVSNYLSGNRSYTTTYKGSVYILKIKPDKELEWMQAFALSQNEYTYPIYSGILPIMQNGKDLFLFFHDHIQHTGAQPEPNAKAKAVPLENSWSQTQLTSFHVNEKGHLNRIRVENYVPDKHRFAPVWPVATYEGEGIFTLYDHKNLGRSTYKLGLYKINQ